MKEIVQTFLPFLVIVISACITGAVSASKKKQQDEKRLAQIKARMVQERDEEEIRHNKPAPRPPKPAERQPLRPTLHDHSGMFDGSLRADDGTEGRKPGDPPMPSEHSEDIINGSLTGTAAPRARRPAVLPELSGGNLARAFVLQEVLKRPGQRR